MSCVGCVLALVCVLVTRSIFDVQEELSANEQPPRWPDHVTADPLELAVESSSSVHGSRATFLDDLRISRHSLSVTRNLIKDEWVDRVFGYATGLFVLESGANNGVAHSNSLFLEIGRQWRCLLVEANPELAPVIRALHRKCHFLSGGLSITDGVSSFPFVGGAPWRHRQRDEQAKTCPYGDQQEQVLDGGTSGERINCAGHLFPAESRHASSGCQHHRLLVT